ncbi:MAG: hypothetical protein D6704_13820 [Nitrospirae bacterium]|nr:MAG: hypothetical protein D6704_13820 [Nitrospirota bacterium]
MPNLLFFSRQLAALGLTSALIVVGTSSLAAGPRTESICNLGMVKGETDRRCHIPIPAGCSVAQYPGFDEPWADISKGGAVSCQFDTAQTDWQTTVVGVCGPCKTEKCSARFSVMLNCSGDGPSPPAPR